MTESETRENCSISRCVRPGLHTESGTVGHWSVTIFYCDEHHRELEQGTPLGPIGVDPAHVRIESTGRSDIPDGGNRFPGIA